MDDDRKSDPNRPTCVIFYGPSIAPDKSYPDRWRKADDLFAEGPGDEPALLIVDPEMLESRDRLRKLPRRVVFVASDQSVQEVLGRRCSVSIAGLDVAGRSRVLQAACLLACGRSAGVALRKRLAQQKLQSRELNRIGLALMVETDSEELLRQIVRQGKRLTDSDAGALLLMETDEHNIPRLRPVFWEVDFHPDLPTPPITYRVDDASLLGYAAQTGMPIVEDDVYNLPKDVPYQHDKTLDQTYGVYTKSALVVPMIDHRGQTVGVLGLSNRKSDPSARIKDRESADRYVLRYTDRELQLTRSLASQAAVSIEIHQLYKRIENMLEAFVEAGVTAIDQRDPATAGHSLRVAALPEAMAVAINRSDRGAYRDAHFSRAQIRELRFAALVHDVGKVVVREAVLMKSKKLPPVLWERVEQRFALIHRTMELEYCERRAALQGGSSQANERRRLEAELAEQLAELDRVRAIVAAANEPTPLPSKSSAELSDIASRTFEHPDGRRMPYLTEEELHFLQIPSGTLDAEERAAVESHVTQARRFLGNIPFTDDLENLVTYACDHHEKLDGSGYPAGLKGDEIPLQARLITLADIFDALTEADRPYKPAMSTDAALDILRQEAWAGRLDPDLVDLMIESRAYERNVVR